MCLCERRRDEAKRKRERRHALVREIANDPADTAIPAKSERHVTPGLKSTERIR